MRSAFLRWPYFLLLPTLIFVCFELGLALFQPVRTDDVFWHLKIGERLLQEKGFPKEEALLFTHDPNLPPLYHEWLFQIAVKTVENFGGLVALRFFLPLCALCIVWALLRFCRLFEARPLGLLLAVLMFFLFSYQRLIQLRPELFSMIFFFVLLHNLVRGREHFSLPRILLAVFVSCLWANSHSLCLILFLFWALWIGCAWIQVKVFKQALAFDWKGQISGFVGSLLAMSANPMGFTLFYFYFKGNARNPYVNVIDEWGHFKFSGLRDFLPLSSDVLTGGMALLVLWSALLFVVVALGLRNKRDSEPERLEAFHLFFLGAASILSLCLAAYAVRFFWLALFPALFLLSFFRERVFLSGPGPRALCLFLFCAATVWHFQLKETLSYRIPLSSPEARKVFWKWDYDRAKYHALSVKFMKDTGIKGNVFNPYFMGGFLSYRLNPKVRVFIDGRFEHYTRQVNQDFFELKNAGMQFQETVQKYGVDLFFVPAEKEFLRLILALRKTGRVVLYRDETLVLFCDKSVFENPELKKALAHHYRTTRNAGAIPVNDAAHFSDFVDQTLRSRWKIPSETLKNKTAAEIRKECGERLEEQLLHGFLEDALEFCETVSDRVPLEDPFFTRFREVFAERNQLDWQFSERKD